jgi:tRNA nucleotidyltransferase (CCA-adding enzyme)
MNSSKHVDITLPEPVQIILNTLRGGGYDTYVVGGCLRDCIMGKTPHDWDIATAAVPQTVAALCRDAHVAETGLKHGTLTVVQNGMPVEVTTFRVDGCYSDARRPDSVTYTTLLHQDLARRDFTVNAMAYCPGAPLVDLFGGEADIQTGLIRCVGDPYARFSEDALRILRAFRFAMRLHFSVEAGTKAAMSALCGSLQKIASERITDELISALSGDCNAAMLAEYQFIFAALWEPWCCLPGPAWEALSRSAAKAGDVIVRIALLCGEQNESPDCLRLDNNSKRRLRQLLQRKHEQVPASKPDLLRRLSEWGIQGVRDRLEYGLAVGEESGPAEALERVLLENPCFSIHTLAVNGRDLIALGVPPGPGLGLVLQALLDAVIDGTAVNEKEPLLRRAETLYKPM